jgi:hypothetical protein
VSDAQKTDTWNLTPRILSRLPITAIVLWCIAQPLIDGVLQHPGWLSVGLWIVGVIVIYAVVFGYRYQRAAPYRSMLSAARVARPGSIVYGIRLDPLTTPVGVEWGDSRVIRWGFLRASPEGVEIVRSDGASLLCRPWSEIEFSACGIDVRSGVDVEEWWFRVMSGAGPWARALSLHLSRQSIARMQELRNESVTGSQGTAELPVTSPTV